MARFLLFLLIARFFEALKNMTIVSDDIQKRISICRDGVLAELNKLLPHFKAPFENQLSDAMRYAVFSGGKRMRPFLVLSVAHMFGVNDKQALRVAAAIEMIHICSLILDDLPAMDNADTRHNKPTVHIQFNEATALLATSGLNNIAYRILNDPLTHTDANTRCELVNLVAETVSELLRGQTLDLVANQSGYDDKVVSDLHRLKTGSLLACALGAGAILGNASAEERQALRKYGYLLGEAYQTTDDILDATGSKEALGKSTGRDAEAQKTNFVTLRGIKGAHALAGMLLDQAIDQLARFGESAEDLRTVARHVVQRPLDDIARLKSFDIRVSNLDTRLAS
jgi:farnesyl diphosphate synthase